MCIACVVFIILASALQYFKRVETKGGIVGSERSNTALTPYVTTCTPSTCGENALCTLAAGRPVCSCPRGYYGDPIYLCKRAECLDTGDCPGHLTCINEKCSDPCQSSCGTNANCETRNHVPVCSCPPGYTGNPFTSCRKFDPEELCNPSPCGKNTACQVVEGVATCRCLPDFYGSPSTGCRRECEINSECGPGKSCIDYKCQDPCSQCGKSSECEVENHVAVCKCPKGYYGNPLVSCNPECTSHSECPSGRPACIYNSCKNPCEGVCGVGANCELRGITPICSCPKDMTGDPFVRCRPFTKEDLCDPNPCGAHARCEPGYDKYNKERPVCTCNSGYTGDPLTGCVKGECSEDSHCADSQACIDYKCQSPCIGQCGLNANCDARRHVAVCTCPSGYKGDALTSCYPSGNPVAARYLRLF